MVTVRGLNPDIRIRLSCCWKISESEIIRLGLRWDGLVLVVFARRKTIVACLDFVINVES